MFPLSEPGIFDTIMNHNSDVKIIFQVETKSFYWWHLTVLDTSVNYNSDVKKFHVKTKSFLYWKLAVLNTTMNHRSVVPIFHIKTEKRSEEGQDIAGWIKYMEMLECSEQGTGEWWEEIGMSIKGPFRRPILRD